jgi:hypothetical protein
MILVLLSAAVALQAWAWRRLRQRVTSGAMTKLAALLQYGAWALTPLVFFIGLFLAAVGAEELTGAAIIAEPLGRAVLLVTAVLLGVAAIGWVSFLVLCGLVWRVPGASS